MYTKRLSLVVAGLAICLYLIPALAETGKLATPNVSAELKAEFPKPYIIKKGDTLWGISERFFKDPWKWVKIWEGNLYISNPDLIYPGNEVWFEDGKLVVVKPGKKKKPTVVQFAPPAPRPTVVLAPNVREKPVQKLENKTDTSLMLSALARQDLIRAEAIQGVGHIVGTEDERINFSTNDRVYLKLGVSAKDGDLFDVFRTGETLEDPVSGDEIGVLVSHLGQIRVTSQSSGVYRGTVVNTFQELQRGDRLKPARSIDLKVTPVYPEGKLQGHILYIRDFVAEAGQHQVVGISLGNKEGIQTGTVLSVHRAGKEEEDSVTGDDVTLPEEKIGEMIVLVPQPNGALALVTQSTAPINLGDAIRNQAGR